MFYGGRKTSDDEIFFLFLNLSAVPQKSTPGKFAYHRHFQRNWNKHITFDSQAHVIQVHKYCTKLETFQFILPAWKLFTHENESRA